MVERDSVPRWTSIGRTVVCFTVLAAAAMAIGEPKTILVSAANYGKPNLDGRTEATAFGTIQDGVTNAVAGDVVEVLEGVYDRGGEMNSSVGGATSNRVFISKAITVRSRSGSARTVIVGAPDFAGEPNHGLGPAAVRCVCFSDVAAVLQGFTLTGGYVNQSTGSDGACVRGGGVLVTSGCKATGPIVVDCVISNNVATRGGGAFGGRYVRTLIADNRVYNTAASTTKNAPACRTCALYDCVIAANGAPDESAVPIMGWMQEIVNCTIVDNRADSLFQSAISGSGNFDVVNCYISHAGSLGSNYACSSCVVNGTRTADDTAIPDYPLAAPLFADWRPVAARGLSGIGDVTALDRMPAGYRDLDFLRQPRKTGDTVSVGAIEAAVTPAGGVLAFSTAGGTVDGRPIRANGYVHAVEWPVQVRLEPAVPAEGFGFFAYLVTETNVVSGGAAVGYPAFPDRRGGRYFTLPEAGLVRTLAAKEALLIHVDGAAEESGADGSAKKPYKTIQAAVDSYNDASTVYRVIRVADGEYTGCTAYSTWGNAAVVLQKNILLTSVNGPSKTTIRGQSDETESGLGPNAARCVILANSTRYVGVSGFTLTGGRSAVGTSGSDAKGQGGAFRASSALTHQVMDCVISACSASRGPGAYLGWCDRCLIENCTDASGENATDREGVLTSCVLRDNTAPHNIIGQNVKAYNCSGKGRVGMSNCYSGSAVSCLPVNCLFVGGRNSLGAADTSVYYSNFGDSAESTSRTQGMTYGDAMLANRANGDLRPCYGSPLEGGGDPTAPDWSRYVSSDFNGRPMRFVNGRPTIGAFQDTVATVIVPASPNVEFDCGLTNVVEAGESFTVTVRKTVKRNVLGIRVDGEDIPGTFSWTVTGEPNAAPVTVEAITSSHWYVDPSKDDANDGFSPETAKKTLVAAMGYVLPGDTVHAAEGDYREGAVLCPIRKASAVPVTVRSRVVVSNGVTLVASGARERTTIYGGSATAAREPGTTGTNLGDYQSCFEKYGMGPDAIRCVTLLPGAEIRGFTLTKGAIDVENQPGYENDLGGAVLGHDAAACRVIDCEFRENASGRGSAAYVTLERCRFVGNLCAWNCPIARFSTLIGCIASENCGSPLSDQCYGFYGCTIHDNYSSANKYNKLAVLFNQSDGRKVPLVNTLLLQAGSSSQTNVFCDVSNCVFLADTYYRGTNSVFGVSTVRTVAEVLDANDVPLLGGPAIDRGDAALSRPEWNVADADGGQRIYNGELDIGAIEYDYRSEFSKALGSRFVVDAADPAVRLRKDGETTVGVEMPSGSLSGHWRLPPNETSMTVSIARTVEGEGQLAVTNAGAAFAERGEVDADHNAFFFAFTPEADGSVALLNKFRADRGLMLIVR